MGVSVKRDLLKAYRFFGYCPQRNPLLGDLTCEEWLEMVSMMRGIPRNRIKWLSDSLAEELCFTDQMHKKVEYLSGGNKRKLTTALSFIGSPVVVYMDEPTSGMDPAGKRCVWNMVLRYRELGNSILLSSHSMDECEALCNRMIIMYNGKMEAIASSYQLKKKYSKTGSLVIQLKREFGGDQENLAEMKRVLGERLKGFEVK